MGGRAPFRGAAIFPIRLGRMALQRVVAHAWIVEDHGRKYLGSAHHQIERHALPQLRAIKTLDDYLAFVSRHMFRHKLFEWPHCKIIVDVALGDLAAARSLCREKLQHWSVDRPNYDEDDRAENRRLRELCARLAADHRAGLARLLHE